jgi:hypothetical protein
MKSLFTTLEKCKFESLFMRCKTWGVHKSSTINDRGIQKHQTKLNPNYSINTGPEKLVNRVG